MHILSFDGGGLRSIFSARVIQRMLMTQPTLMDRTDLLAGTSGGAIVAAGLAFGLMPAEIVQLFAERADEIFEPDSFVDDVADLWDLEGARYDNKGLKKVLSSVFGTATLGDLRKKIAIPAYDLRGDNRRAQPMLYHNYRGDFLQLPLVDVIMRSAAAPAYFPVFQKHGDGGMFANHPGLKALALAMGEAYGNQRNLRSIALLSIGTGRTGLYLKTSKNDLGPLDWVRNDVFDFLIDGTTDSIDRDLMLILGPNYHRVQVDIDVPVKLDDISEMSTMLRLADDYDGTQLRAWLQGFW